LIPGYVEPVGEGQELARRETISAAEALGGSEGGTAPEFPYLVSVEIPGLPELERLAGRLSLARRCLVRLASEPDIGSRLATEGRTGGSAAVRRLGSPSGSSDPTILAAGRQFVDAGGRIDLRHPQRRFWLGRDSTGRDWLFEERGTIDRAAMNERRMPRLPFRRPVSLPPRLGRAAANLARVREGSRVLDPFLGTGALLAEAGLLGAHLYGIDRDPEMVRGALRNLAHLGVGAEELIVGDAAEVEFEDPQVRFDAVLTDAPYGRSSSTGGEPVRRLVQQVVPRWAHRLAPGGRVVLIVPKGSPEMSGIGRLVGCPALRVHRSLTREFRVYEPIT